MKKFMNKVIELYNKLIESNDSIYKLNAIDECKTFLGIQLDETFGSFYYSICGKNKSTGTVYTPEPISEYMIQSTIAKEDIIRNPYLKILDPSCGIGNIVIPSFKYLKQLFLENLEEINKQNNLCLKKEDVDLHIVNNNLYGIDIDVNVLKILQIDLFSISKCINNNNYICEDFLESDIAMDYDIYIGNPPYIGHKNINKAYREKISTIYKEIYKDKSDLAYCFFYKTINNIKPFGKITFITSRYFMESLSGEALRDFMMKNCCIDKIIDFYGIRPFKYTGIDPVIVFIKPKNDKIEYINVIRASNNTEISHLGKRTNLFLELQNFENFIISKKHLDYHPWVIINEDKRTILKKIEKCSHVLLSDICNSYQGIITGCDKAFIIENNKIKDYSIEKDLLKPWIKSSNIDKEFIRKASHSIIYSNLIKQEELYPKAIEYISHHKSILTKRRECERGVRKWYELQWGRKMDIFEDIKIVFPYKANRNKFALDKGSYFSADVYALKIKRDSNIDYELLVKLLNSKLYNFYFKTFAKKLGGSIYEYYPNNLMRIRVPLIRTDKNIDDNYLYDYFKINNHERRVIENLTK